VRALDLDEEARDELEAALSDLNKRVLDQHTAFDSVKEHLKKAAELLPLGQTDPVSIEAIPSKVFDILARTQVKLESVTGAQIPILRHGSGTQSLAVICLFDAFLQSQMEGSYGEHARPLLTLEEPEAHLHPAAVKAVGELLQKLPGQKLVSTHSGDLLASVPLQKIRRLRRKDGKVLVHRLEHDALSPDEINKLDYHIRTTRGGLLFSRCWLLVEGETEAPLVTECARAMGHDLYADGVSCIEFAQVGVEKFIKLADQLGIEWFVLADNDAEGKKYHTSAKVCLGARNENHHIRVLDHGMMEVFLCVEGFGDVYEASIADQKKNAVTAKKGSLQYWQQVVQAQQRNSKAKNALIVAEKIVAGGSTAVPKPLREVIDQARKLARSAS
jgi:putative ATP-dependent endonuclease of OLD family